MLTATKCTLLSFYNILKLKNLNNYWTNYLNCKFTFLPTARQNSKVELNSVNSDAEMNSIIFGVIRA